MRCSGPTCGCMNSAGRIRSKPGCRAKMATKLVGGLYGLAIGQMFYGESMFSLRTDASKIAVAHLARFLGKHGFGMVDCQMRTAHLASLGAREIPRREFIERLNALVRDAQPVRWPEQVPSPTGAETRPAGDQVSRLNDSELPFSLLQFYSTTPLYLQLSAGRNRTIAGRHADPSDHDRSLWRTGRAGFRRSGVFTYRPHCDHCRKCVPVRIPLASFAPAAASAAPGRRMKDSSPAECRWVSARALRPLPALPERPPRRWGMDQDSHEQYAHFLLQSRVDTRLVEFSRSRRAAHGQHHRRPPRRTLLGVYLLRAGHCRLRLGPTTSSGNSPRSVHWDFPTSTLDTGSPKARRWPAKPGSGRSRGHRWEWQRLQAV